MLDRRKPLRTSSWDMTETYYQLKMTNESEYGNIKVEIFKLCFVCYEIVKTSLKGIQII